jgi:hypothetical protein
MGAAAAARSDGRRARVPTRASLPPPPPLSGGCCTGTRQRRQRDLVGAHADFGRPARTGQGPPPLIGGCCTSTRVLRRDDMRGAHEDFVCTGIAPAKAKPAISAGLVRQESEQRAVTSSPVAALPWRPSIRSLSNGDGQSYSTGDTSLVPRRESPSLAAEPEPELELAPPEQALSLELPWRRQRAFNWEGSWREDRAQQVGMMELFEALEYPWHIRQIMKAAPGPSWVIKCVKCYHDYLYIVVCRGLHISESFLCDRDMTDDGHTLTFDTNSKVGSHARSFLRRDMRMRVS